MDWGGIFFTILGSGAFSVLVTYLLNIGFNNKKLNAEIVSKARIEWIDKFRDLSSNYLYEGYRSIEVGKLYCKQTLKLDTLSWYRKEYRICKKEKDKTVETYNDTVINMTKYFIQIRLYIPKRGDGTYQDEHEKIIMDIKELSGKLNNAFKNKDERLFNNLQINEMQNLADYIGQYLKQEWDIAKQKK
ncbi:hypothetical protein [Staphylococcus aureus]|uniref:hypothetical protein n=1 Tax=Staphylococcus aureus TaxID=1280 RepID=UPI00215CCB0D|nr:hypothetical protein [Staphylococcus aureus]UVJ06534.1 hypothetical protein NW973_06265 [Staphylococcus aureus]